MPKSSVIPLSKDEMDLLLDAAIGNDFYYMLFLTAKTTGRRLGEFYGNQKKIELGRKVVGKKIEYYEGKTIALDRTRLIYKRIPNEYNGGVQVKDINFEKSTIKIWVLKRKKLEQDETILTPEVLRTIKHYILKNELKHDSYLFRKVSYRAIQLAVESYAKKAKIPHKVSFHNFRHYFITELKRKGYSNDQIMKLTGHKNIGTLIIYDHIVATDLKEQVMKDLMDI